MPLSEFRKKKLLYVFNTFFGECICRSTLSYIPSVFHIRSVYNWFYKVYSFINYVYLYLEVSYPYISSLPTNLYLNYRIWTFENNNNNNQIDLSYFLNRKEFKIYAPVLLN